MSLLVTDEPLPLPHYPRVNLNGTARSELVKQRIAAGQALSEAITALIAAEPHARDYPYQSGRGSIAAYTLARELHVQRIAALQDMRNELLREAECLQDGGQS